MAGSIEHVTSDENEWITDYSEFCEMIENLSDAFEMYEEMRDLIKLQRQALLDCPIVGEVHRDSNDRFKEWNLKYEYILQGEQNEKI